MLINLRTNLRILWLKNPADFIAGIILIFISILSFF